MEAITYDRIKISGGIELKELCELEFRIEPNQHAFALITGIADMKEIKGKWDGHIRNHEIEIIFLDENGKEPAQPVFAGIINTITYEYQSDIPFVRIELKSGTVLLDRIKKRRSFQDVTLTYENIIDAIIKETKYADCIYSADKAFIKKPLIQYKETDWEFFKRLASHLMTAVYPDVKTTYPRLWFGFPQSSKTIKISCTDYTAGISERYYDTGIAEMGYSQSEFAYYEINSLESHEVGTAVQFKGRNWIIYKKSAKLIKNRIIFSYLLCHPALVSLKKYYNPLFTGMSILGTVISVQGETVKIHLDIDGTQNKEKAYAYKWIPDTGSVMYCMPKQGSRVSLYFPNEDERSARAVNCVRVNGGNCHEMSDTSRRCLNTEHGKKMFLNPENIGFSSSQSNYLKLEDECNLVLESIKAINIVAEKSIKFKGKTAVLETPTEINMVRG